MASGSLNSERKPGLDLLRAIAILSVIPFHARYTFKWPLPPPFYGIAQFGWMGVDLFFVLSGYLIGSQLLKPYASGERPSMTRFYVNRALRILPAYLVVLFLYIAVPTLRERPTISPWWHFSTFTLNYLIDYEHNKAFSHAWSLCVEEHYYLLFPLLAALLVPNSSVLKTVLLSIGLFILGMTLRAYLWHQVGTNGDVYVEKIYYPTHVRFEGLLVGVLTASLKVFRPQWWDRLQRSANGVLVCGLILVAAAISVYAPDRFGYGASVFGFPLLAMAFGLLVVAAAGDRSVIGRFRVPGAATVATLAYSTYLIHKQMISWDQPHLGSWIAVSKWVALAILLSSSLLAGAALHFAIERPFLRLRDRVLKRTTSTAALPGVQLDETPGGI